MRFRKINVLFSVNSQLKCWSWSPSEVFTPPPEKKHVFVCLFVSDGELNVLEDILTEAPDQDDELYNPESEREVSDKKGKAQKYISVHVRFDCEKCVL